MKTMSTLFRIFSVCIFYFSYTEASQRNTNKEKFSLVRENFSQNQDINFEGLYKHIRYEFKDRVNLVEALYPLLPKPLQLPKQKFDHLEFIGDSVLGLIIRERVLDLFPATERGLLVELYNTLTKNKTLTEIYIDNLSTIEQYLPYPGKEKCEYCNVVEAIIGSIYKDDQKNGLKNAKKFVMTILSDHILNEKLEQVKYSGETPTKKFIEDKPIASSVENILNNLLKNTEISSISPKSFLNEILAKVWNDYPEYSISLDKDENDCPVYRVQIFGAQIGFHIGGIGFSKTDAEEDAAREAVNYLAQKELIPKKISNWEGSYINFVEEYCRYYTMVSSYEEIISLPSFTTCIEIDEETIFRGWGGSKALSKESAARKAYGHLIGNQESNPEPEKTYRSLLKEFCEAKNISPPKVTENSTQMSFSFFFRIGEEIHVEGAGSSKLEAKENAYRAAFDEIRKKEEEARKQKELHKSSFRTERPLGGISSTEHEVESSHPLDFQVEKTLESSNKNNVQVVKIKKKTRKKKYKPLGKPVGQADVAEKREKQIFFRKEKKNNFDKK